MPVRLITAGLIDRTIDRWEIDCGASTLKNTVAALVRVLDEAVRDGLIPTNPARSRSRRTWNKVAGRLVSPRSQALADLPSLMRLVAAVSAVEPVYGAWVMLCALLSARGSEVNGLMVGDVDLEAGVVHIRRQVYPRIGGLVTKQTKGRAERMVPVLEPLRPVLEGYRSLSRPPSSVAGRSLAGRRALRWFAGRGAG
jgi:integrase